MKSKTSQISYEFYGHSRLQKNMQIVPKFLKRMKHHLSGYIPLYIQLEMIAALRLGVWVIRTQG
jgi:hypothetical protein